MSSSRQLAAIMFTDIVGYTALMGDDEQRAFEILRENRQLQQPIIKQFNGTWIKEIGDGVLASFHTVIDAVLCASEIQKSCESIDGLKLRIGIHHTAKEFWHKIAEDWPSWFGFLLSFCIIFVNWFNHHLFFNLIDKSSTQFIYANGFLLFTIIILPFGTGIMAEYLLEENSQPAISLYCLGVLLNNIGWNVSFTCQK